MTPARAHRLKFEVAQSATRKSHDYGGVLDEMHEQFFNDKRLLKAIRSVKEKEDAKRLLLPKYASYIESVMAHDSGEPDSLFSTLIVWTLDAGDIDKALDMAQYALRHQLESPDAHQRTIAEFITEDTIEKLTDINGDIDVSARPMLERLHSMMAQQSIVDPVRAKLEKALGVVALADDEPGTAYGHFTQALAFNPKSGCKQLMAKADKQRRQQSD
ncbi:hypothetical protein LMG33818_002631 [Halomonadaceae bacterium LMG 33818]|uniref:phage terminase small subunit n=1 Tax=Cernens ardua TaxID=3402176 RepID=UPI003EDC269B